jgi:prephenate dehydratase
MVLIYQDFFFEMKKIGIQGIKGSFHDQVAQSVFDMASHQIVEYMSFDSLTKGLIREDIDLAIMAIENSIAGSILPNYALLDRNNLSIIKEHFLQINHHLMALPGQSLTAIREVHSHPMALLQCVQFFDAYPEIRLVEAEDTALVAQKIQTGKLSGIAAIAGKGAAEIYQLDVLAPQIQTIKNNVTRFVIVSKKPVPLAPEFNKAALKFTLDHQRGSLATVLNVMSDCQLNLTKIQSLPVIETPGKYAFFVDVTFENIEQYKKAKSILEIMALQFKVLGVYQKEN